MPAINRLLLTLTVKQIGEDGLPFGDVQTAEAEIPVDKLYPFAPEKRMLAMRASDLGSQLRLSVYDALKTDGVA